MNLMNRLDNDFYITRQEGDRYLFFRKIGEK